MFQRGMTAASLRAVGEVVQHGAVEKLNIGANNLAELGSADQCVEMRTAMVRGPTMGHKRVIISQVYCLPQCETNFLLNASFDIVRPSWGHQCALQRLREV